MIRSKWTTVALMSTLCVGASAARAEPPVHLRISNILTSAVRDSDGVRPGTCTDRSALLIRAAQGTPLLAPDGHQLTWAEWARPIWVDESTASIQCTNQGTHVVIHLAGLIPRALYSSWLFVQQTDDAPIDSGRLPSIGSKNNGVRADKNGRADIDVVAPPGPLSISGSITKCLFDFQNFSINFTYHSDGHLYGDVPGPAGITVQQFNFEY